MRRVAVRNRSRDVLLADRVRVAETWWTRLRGMIGRPAPRPGEGMWLLPSRGVHMWWMRYPLDVALLGPEHRVVATFPELEPGSGPRTHREARSALELPAGTLARSGTRVGDELELAEPAAGRGARMAS